MAYVMAQCRRILVWYGGISADKVNIYSLHLAAFSKSHPLLWAVQVGVKTHMRRIWGHARDPGQDSTWLPNPAEMMSCPR